MYLGKKGHSQDFESILHFIQSILQFRISEREPRRMDVLEVKAGGQDRGSTAQSQLWGIFKESHSAEYNIKSD